MKNLKTWAVLGFVAGLSTVCVLTSCNKGKETTSTDSSSAGDAPKVQFFKASDPKNLKLAFVTNNTAEFWKIAAAGVHKYEKETGVQVDIKQPPTGKTEEQDHILETLGSQGYNGVAVSVIAPPDQLDVVNTLASKANLITFDSDAPKSNRILYIGTNNFTAGQTLGKQIVKMLPNGGKMAVFVGTFSADNAAQRLGGIEDAIKGHNIDIVARKEDGADSAKGGTNVEDVINAYPNLNIVCGLYSYNGPAIADAIEAAGKKGKLLAAVFDEEQGTLIGIEKGLIQVTCVQKPFMEGYLASKWIHDLAVEGSAVKLPPDGKIDTGVDLIDSTNVTDFEKKLAEMKAAG